MFTLRCTQRLLRRIPSFQNDAVGETTTVLGDWYANLLNVGRLRLVLCTSERSLLTVVVPARNLAALPQRLGEAVDEVLAALGVTPETRARERYEMRTHRIGPTANRQVLGSMNDFAYLADAYIRGDGREVNLPQISRKLSEAPCSPIKMESPDRFTLELFGRAT